jgi:hypothetical protein
VAIDNEPRPDERLAKAVTRLALDRKFKSAVKLVMQDAERTDSSFEEKVEQLSRKFPPRAAPVASLTAERTTPFPSEVVLKVLQKMSRNSSTCIDTWTKDLLWQAVEIDRSIADDVGVLCAYINDGLFDENAMEIVRLGRLVAIPKPDGGVRPVVVSSFFAKFTGACVLETSKMTCTNMQFAIARPRGAERIVHLAREAYEKGKALLRLDISNAFNATPRAQIAACLEDAPAEMRMYFNTMYVPEAHLCVYGPNGRTHIVRSVEGVRQGDAASALLFCKVMDRACVAIKQEFRRAEVWCYMDDLTVACEASEVSRIAQFAHDTFAEIGLRVNLDKSAVTARSERDRLVAAGSQDAAAAAAPAPRLAVVEPSEPFVMLGACINEAAGRYNGDKRAGVDAFFDKLFRCDLHPQLRWTILRLCGAPRLSYAAATMLPTTTEVLVKHFERRLSEAANTIIGAQIESVFLHDVAGAGFPDYVAGAPRLYEESKSMALTGGSGVKVELATNLFPEAADLRSQRDAPYLFFTSDRFARMTPAIFQLATAIRLRTLPAHVQRELLPLTCNCGHRMESPCGVIDHAFRCHHLSNVTFTHRHDAVKLAIAAVVRSYGVAVSVEPKNYVYSSGKEERPDLLIHLPVKITTDVTIVNTEEASVGAAARAAASAKEKKHGDAVARMGHQFIPFAMEVHGFRDVSCFQFASAISKQLPAYQQRSFHFDLVHAVSRALAVMRAETILGISAQRWRN